MKFTALPVNVGDSFLLNTDEKVVLVDGGMNKSHILKLLKNEMIPNNHIDLLVCTHYDADHINGIISILKSNKYSFKELWLPEILGSIGYTLSEKIEELFNDLRHNNSSIEDEYSNNNSVFDLYNSEIITEDSANFNSFEKINNNRLSYFCKSLFDFHFHFYSASNYKLISTAKSVASLITHSLNSGANIRWFKYQNKAIHKTYGFDMYCQNSVQAEITVFDSRLLFLALYEISLSKINKYSLVYMHQKKDVPDILFTADSDLSFYETPVILKDNSLITAPHHGSSANDSAYSKVSGVNLTYVRSDRSQQIRPGKGYLKNPNRFCTICRNITQKKKVEFNLTGTMFATSTIACKC